MLLVAAVLPLLVVSALQLQRERAMVRAANVELLQARTDEIGHTLEAMHRGYEAVAAAAARDPELVAFASGSAEVEGFSRRTLAAQLAAFAFGDPAIRGVGLLDRNGTVMAATERQLEGVSLAYREYFRRALVGAETNPEVYVSVPAAGRVPSIAYAAAVRSRAGELVGVYVLWVRAQALWDVMATMNDTAGRGSFIALFDRHGVRIGHSRNPKLLFRPSAPLPDEAVRAMLAESRFLEKTSELLSDVVPFPLAEIQGQGRKVFRRLSPTNDVWNLAASRHFPALGWTLVAHVPESEVEVRVASVLPRVLPAALVGLMLVFVGSALLMRKVVKPIGDLAGTAAALERGDFTVELGEAMADRVGARDEVGALARAFRSMARALADRDRILRTRNCDLQQVLDNVGQGFLAVDFAGVVSAARSAILEKWFGELRTEERFWRYVARDDEKSALAIQRAWQGLFGDARQRETSLAELPLRLLHGERTFDLAYRPVEVQGRVDRVVVVISDVTTALAKERKERELEWELQHAQKMEAVGRLASGIAHEINTPIQFIGDNARFAQEAFTVVSERLRQQSEAMMTVGVPVDIQQKLEQAAEATDLEYMVEEAPKAMSRALEGVQRVARIVRAMKEFAHPDQNEMAATDVNRSLLATIDVARNEYKYVADVETDFGDIPTVTCHKGELNQVFLNIIVNAAHAIEDVVKGTQSKGTIRVKTHQEGAQVIVSISDTGGGIPEAIRDKLFEPFFTTKEVGRGTGQGLAIARNVIAKHHGQLTFTSAIGQGTTFFIKLPIEQCPALRATA